jgi:hypothetical protein
MMNLDSKKNKKHKTTFKNTKSKELLCSKSSIDFLEDLISIQRKIWQPFYEETLTDNDVAEIHNNIIQLGELAFRWNKNSKQNSNNVIESDGE